MSTGLVAWRRQLADLGHSYRDQAVCAGLIIAGAFFEAIGLGLIFVELMVIRSDEFGVPAPWERARRWVRRLLRKSEAHTLSLESALAISGAMRVRGYKRPGPVKPGATVTQRLRRLEKYVAHIDEDVEALHKAIGDTASELEASAREREGKLREELSGEIARLEEQRRKALRPSLQRQGLGATFVLVGLLLGTVGNLA